MTWDNLVTFYGFKELYCPECLDKKEIGVKTKTLETRHYLDESNQPIVRRRHYCPECMTSFYTMESAEN